MARNGSGTYSLYTPGNPVVTGTTISSTAFNNTMNDIAAALTASIAADGQTPITANIPFGSHKATGLAAGTTSGDALVYGQSGASVTDLTATATLTATTGIVPGNSANASATVLDWYEEGTFTPGISGIGSPTLTSNDGTFQRVGNCVQFSLYVSWTGGTNAAAISGITNLPYTSKAGLLQPLSLLVNYLSGGLTYTGVPVAYVNGGSSVLVGVMASASSLATLNNPNAGTKDLMISGRYFV